MCPAVLAGSCMYTVLSSPAHARSMSPACGIPQTKQTQLMSFIHAVFHNNYVPTTTTAQSHLLANHACRIPKL